MKEHVVLKEKERMDAITLLQKEKMDMQLSLENTIDTKDLEIKKLSEMNLQMLAKIREQE